MKTYTEKKKRKEKKNTLITFITLLHGTTMAEDAGIEGRTAAEFALTVRAAYSDTSTVPH
jgi:hypothetical protein